MSSDLCSQYCQPSSVLAYSITKRLVSCVYSIANCLVTCAYSIANWKVTCVYTIANCLVTCAYSATIKTWKVCIATRLSGLPQ